jgi:excisionase family DNA binding protein
MVQIFEHRDWIAASNLRAHTYPYGGGRPGHGIQLDVRPEGKDPYAIRLPAGDAQQLARAILATYDGADGPDALLTPSEVAALFRVDPKTVTRWANTGRLRSISTPGGHRRFWQSEVAELAAKAGRQ